MRIEKALPFPAKKKTVSPRKAPEGVSKEDCHEGLAKSSTCKVGVQVSPRDLVILPKYRRKVLYGKLRRRVGEIIRELCRQKEIGLEEGKAAADHIHMLLSVPPKYSVAMTVGYLKGKSAIRIHRELLKTKGTLFGRSFWARGYCVSTVGLDEQRIRKYIREQEKMQQEQTELDLD